MVRTQLKCEVGHNSYKAKNVQHDWNIFRASIEDWVIRVHVSCVKNSLIHQYVHCQLQSQGSNSLSTTQQPVPEL